VTLEDGEMPYADKRILSHSGGSIEGDEAVKLTEFLLHETTFADALSKARISIYPPLIPADDSAEECRYRRHFAYTAP
jgi:2,3-bisphosphoglycerate-independent phosphoglycerate mutase